MSVLVDVAARLGGCTILLQAMQYCILSTTVGGPRLSNNGQPEPVVAFWILWASPGILDFPAG